MSKCLFLLCPTDCLESKINANFKYENYFYTSLGNSFIHTKETIEHIKGTVIQKNIRKIYFVLSIDNQIILDALGSQDFSDIRKLRFFYNQISNQQKVVKMSWKKRNLKFGVLSYFLNLKIKELNTAIVNLGYTPPKINAKIYIKNLDEFTNISSPLLYLEKHCLN
ncbi:hypothetical protein [Seonamhaeicola sp.]|uniref:hypothetical protein n=1 Tax=Seonamhaeicola sp. TaxID=1912245 RepID=UPI003564215B